VQEGPLGDLAPFYLKNALQLHQQRWVILHVDSLAVWKMISISLLLFHRAFSYKCKMFYMTNAFRWSYKTFFTYDQCMLYMFLCSDGINHFIFCWVLQFSRSFSHAFDGYSHAKFASWTRHAVMSGYTFCHLKKTLSWFLSGVSRSVNLDICRSQHGELSPYFLRHAKWIFWFRRRTLCR
jgi:hypothetical protein